MSRSISSWGLRASAVALALVSVVMTLAPTSQGDILDPAGFARASAETRTPTARRDSGRRNEGAVLPSTAEAFFLHAGPFGPRHAGMSSRFRADEPEWYAAACARSDLSFVAGDARLVGAFATAGRRSRESSLVRLMTWYAEAENIARRTPQPVALRNDQAALGADAVAALALSMAGTGPARN